VREHNSQFRYAALSLLTINHVQLLLDRKTREKKVRKCLITILLDCYYSSSLFTAACGRRKHKGTIGCGLLRGFSLRLSQAFFWW